MTISILDLSRVAAAAQEIVAERGQTYYQWTNEPEVSANGFITHKEGYGDEAVVSVITASEALAIMGKKIDGAYGERFICSLGAVAALIMQGYSVRLVQFRREPGVPFDAAGWLVVVIETMPIFHVSPDDIRTADIADLVEILDDNQSQDVCWKGTNKVGEFAALLSGATRSGLDLVAIARAASK